MNVPNQWIKHVQTKLIELVGLRKVHVVHKIGPDGEPLLHDKKGAHVLDSKKMKTLQANYVKASLKVQEPQAQDAGSHAPQANLATVAETSTASSKSLSANLAERLADVKDTHKSSCEGHVRLFAEAFDGLVTTHPCMRQNDVRELAELARDYS